jgi:hypothetical protein
MCGWNACSGTLTDANVNFADSDILDASSVGACASSLELPLMGHRLVRTPAIQQSHRQWRIVESSNGIHQPGQDTGHALQKTSKLSKIYCRHHSAGYLHAADSSCRRVPPSSVPQSRPRTPRPVCVCSFRRCLSNQASGRFRQEQVEHFRRL